VPQDNPELELIVPAFKQTSWVATTAMHHDDLERRRFPLYRKRLERRREVSVVPGWDDDADFGEGSLK
jgi:hypothetical protein